MTKKTTVPVIDVLLVSGHTVTILASEHDRLQQAINALQGDEGILAFARYGGGTVNVDMADVVGWEAYDYPEYETED